MNRVDPLKTYHLFKFDKGTSEESIIWAIRLWFDATGNIPNGDVVPGLDGDDFVQNKITVLVPYIPAHLFGSLCIDADGTMQDIHPWHVNCRCL